MSSDVRIGIYRITRGSYAELVDQARRLLAPFLRDSPGFVSYSLADVGNGRAVSIGVWETREEAEAATSIIAEWIRSVDLADAVALEENLIGEMTTLAALPQSEV